MILKEKKSTLKNLNLFIIWSSHVGGLNEVGQKTDNKNCHHLQ